MASRILRATPRALVGASTAVVAMIVLSAGCVETRPA